MLLAFRIALLIALGWYTSWTIALTAFIINVTVFHRKTAWLLIKTFRRDLSALLKFREFVVLLRSWQRNNETAVTMFEKIVDKHPNKTMFVFGEKKWSFAEANQFTKKVATFFAAKGLHKGDNVAVMMSNCPEMVLMWLGLARIGVASGLINYNLRKAPLIHSMNAIQSKAVIFGPDMISALKEIANELDVDKNSFFCYGEQTEKSTDFTVQPLHELLAATDDQPPPFRGDINDRLIYVFTSGTTGLPKAAVMKNYRYLMTAITGRVLVGAKSDDVLYSHLPLYHSAGGFLGIGQTLVFGTTAVIASKFSASRFWSECIKYNCTITQYIGEICSYLLKQPPHDNDRKHSIRMMFGNGMRRTIWPEFVKRFGIKDIKEFYGATEGNANLMNLDRTVGNIGFYPTMCRLSPFFRSAMWNRYFIKVDPETGEPLRNANGLCIHCGPHEPGELVALIDNNKPESAFDGYADKASTSKKIYWNVARTGDRCFATGDILVYDDDGYIYFKDRTGDTFRWKGENVSTTEVENTIAKYTPDKMCIVFGVEVSGCEGKAGMAVLRNGDNRDVDTGSINEILDKARLELPPYAVPLFVRVTKEVEQTGTFKLPKMKLVREGYDISKLQDPIFLLDPSTKKYIRFDETMYEQLKNGKLRL